ncbi:MAG: MMPL family [Roseibaca calidilacus]|uniref:MMPL family n=1 Tax=Roseibaca calidilacus TaxID=1666912 RepID=A0A0P7VTP7_9RHOB|nr:hypothetical protein [Roseibaca calidilacus]KPP90338.1 MAG: MMPL family [Roseibaca calidilacus]CUX80707.1 hypothetical protein Ga0058931_1286 [Roseibaca calidilacus]
MRALFLTLPAALALTACIESDMDLTVLGEDEARVTGYIQMQRQMFEMAGQDPSFCDEEGGTFTLTDTHARCDIDKTGTFAEIMDDGGADAPQDMQAELVHLDSNRVRALMPFAAMSGQMDDMASDPQAMAMAQQMMAGLSVSFSVTGANIESTTGTLSEDGKTATVTLTLDDLLAPETPLQDFETIVTY